MFKNMKHAFILALPVMALATTSCSTSRVVSYEQFRRFAVNHYDQYALDTVPAVYKYNFNKMQANIVFDYTTPTGGSDSLTFSFGYNGIHVAIKDKYAMSLSSTAVDTIEKYYSDLSGIAISIIDERPIDMDYILTGDYRTMIDLTTGHHLTGDFLIRIIQLVIGAADIVSSQTGYIPLEEYYKSKNPIVRAIVELAKEFNLSDQTLVAIFNFLNRYSVTIATSSKSNGDKFNAYLLTDDHGFMRTVDFNASSSFEVSGLLSFKKYQFEEPEEGDKPIGTEAPYRFTMTGSLDFDFDISTEFAY